jgi:hypothetical protein
MLRYEHTEQINFSVCTQHVCTCPLIVLPPTCHERAMYKDRGDWPGGRGYIDTHKCEMCVYLVIDKE